MGSSLFSSPLDSWQLLKTFIELLSDRPSPHGGSRSSRMYRLPAQSGHATSVPLLVPRLGQRRRSSFDLDGAARACVSDRRSLRAAVPRVLAIRFCSRPLEALYR